MDCLYFSLFFSFKKLSVFWVLYIFRVLIFCQMYSRHILCLRTWTALFQVLLNCKVSIKRLTIILLDFPFYLTYAIFQYTFICLYNETMYYMGILFFRPVYFESCVILVWLWLSLFLVWKNFLLWFYWRSICSMLLS